MIKIPKYKAFDHHLWTDFYELVCLLTPDRLLGHGDITDRIQLYVQDGAINIDEYVELLNILPADKEKQLTNILEHFSRDIYNMVQFRVKHYGNQYPFEIVDNVIKLKEGLSLIQEFYLYLLCCSHLSNFSDSQSTLTSEFELFSLECSKTYFGDNLEATVFGKNSLNTNESFKGNKYAKFFRLSEWWNEKLVITPTEFPPTDNGDNGIDIVGIIRFNGDDNPGAFVIAGQCKCQDEWDVYRFSSSADSIRGVINLTHPNANISFIPICFRNNQGNWHQKSKVSGVILMDRQRILSLMHNKLETFAVSDSYNIIKDFLESKEEAV